MSERNDSVDSENSPQNENDERDATHHSAAYRRKLSVHVRDLQRCINCREVFNDASELDADHVISQGLGGANTIRNQASLCRRCHEAKHGERDHAPTVRWMSTGDMINKDFEWYRHFWKDLFPAMSEAALDYRVEPKFNLANETPYQAWHIPLGDLRRLDEVLAESDEIRYVGTKAHRYM